VLFIELPFQVLTTADSS